MTSPQRGAERSGPADEQQRSQTLSRAGRFRGCRDPSGSHSRSVAATMPRRTVQEVTVQDVQKRRNPNKHYVRRLQNLSVSLGFFFQFLLLPEGGKTKRGSDYSGTRREPTGGWLVPSLEKSRAENDTAGVERGVGGEGGFSAALQNVEDNEEKLVTAVALNQTSGW